MEAVLIARGMFRGISSPLINQVPLADIVVAHAKAYFAKLFRVVNSHLMLHSESAGILPKLVSAPLSARV